MSYVPALPLFAQVPPPLQNPVVTNVNESEMRSMEHGRKLSTLAEDYDDHGGFVGERNRPIYVFSVIALLAVGSLVAWYLIRYLIVF
jgi:hypothetical protein